MTGANPATTVTSSVLAACCAGLYGHPLVELMAGQSLHPGGLAATRRLLAEARLPHGARLLDAGCGLGASAHVAALEFGLDVDACDVIASALRRAASLAEAGGARIRFHEASVLHLPSQDGTFAAVLAECVLSTTFKRDALRELRRVTADGGALLVSDVTASETVALPEPLASILCLTQAWRPGELDALLAGSGYRLERGWDDADGLLALIDRLEARISVLAAVARDIGRDGRLDLFGVGLDQFGDPARIGAAFGGIRRLIEAGRIGYRSVVARAV